MSTKSKFAQPVPPVAAKKTVVDHNAEVMRKVRAAPKAKPVVTEPVAQPTHAAQLPDEQTLLDKLRLAWDEYSSVINQPTWVRRITSVALGLLTYGGVFYLSIQLVDMLVAGAMLYSGVGFISFMAAFLGICAALVAATTLGVYVYEFAMAFEASRVRDRFNSWVDGARARFISTSPAEA
jgi:hypothetical protein